MTSRRVAFPVHDPIDLIFVQDRLFAHRLTKDGMTEFVDKLPVATDEVVPFRKALALVDEPIGAALGHPLKRFDFAGGQFYTIGNYGFSVVIV